MLIVQRLFFLNLQCSESVTSSTGGRGRRSTRRITKLAFLKPLCMCRRKGQAQEDWEEQVEEQEQEEQVEEEEAAQLPLHREEVRLLQPCCIHFCMQHICGNDAVMDWKFPPHVYKQRGRGRIVQSAPPPHTHKTHTHTHTSSDLMEGRLIIEGYQCGQIYYKKTLQKKCFDVIIFKTNYKTITLQCKTLSMFSCKRGYTGGSDIAKKILRWIFCNRYKAYYIRTCFREFFCNGFGQDGVQGC